MSGSVDNSKELAELRAKYPNMFIMSADVSLADLTNYLQSKEWIGKGESVVKLSGAGEVFNMNCTMRAELTNDKSVIIKQSRPFVERYPTVAAPFERCDQEAQFYRLVSNHEDGATVAKRTPKLVGTDESSHIMVLEDLGKASDWGQIYDCESKLPLKDAEDLGAWLASLHNLKFESSVVESLQNMGMRNLTWLYVFELPLETECGVDLEKVTPGLTEVANKLRDNKEYKELVRKIGRSIMFRDNETSMTKHVPGESVLLHGDFFPASWMQTEGGAKVIDTEFCHFGAAEWDLGVPLAHLYITNNDEAASKMFDTYKKIRPSVNQELALQIAGIEIMRRLIGLAQLPLKEGAVSLERKIELLKKSETLVLKPAECL
eukprot:TRINITY_DN1869_c4_g1_i1.p1 TRINITY_DN1869_c4_g1~~TRINITY_DN1869_c4_g1_i1.p1  ORF type:complete len:376 (+),score=64.53 TRINITY_DN1869_c4_g1_i1:67-1194(+)